MTAIPPVKAPREKKQTSAAVAKSPAQAGPPLIHAENLWFQVPILQPGQRTVLGNPIRLLTDIYLSSARRSVKTVLEDISFELHPGQRLGIIGANGAGKSTLLRILAGIYRPTSGRLTVNGEAKGLFDTSLGMREEATGLENIYMRGLQMGMRLSEITELVPNITAFAELQEAIEQPLNTYSSGMRLRLALTVSTMIEPDILLLDEWIGAGDASFSKKIKQRMEGLVERSRGFVIATHNETLMKTLCTHGLLLSKGKVEFYGELEPALEHYKKLLSKPHASIT